MARVPKPQFFIFLGDIAVGAIRIAHSGPTGLGGMVNGQPGTERGAAGGLCWVLIVAWAMRDELEDRQVERAKACDLPADRSHAGEKDRRPSTGAASTRLVGPCRCYDLSSFPTE